MASMSPVSYDTCLRAEHCASSLLCPQQSGCEVYRVRMALGGSVGPVKLVVRDDQGPGGESLLRPDELPVELHAGEREMGEQERREEREIPYGYEVFSGTQFSNGGDCWLVVSAARCSFACSYAWDLQCTHLRCASLAPGSEAEYPPACRIGACPSTTWLLPLRTVARSAVVAEAKWMM